jgi:transcriptional regulator with XRE-family HTH domain
MSSASAPEIDWQAFGRKVANLRRQNDLTQEALATVLGRTASWVSQVERGIQPVNRLDVLQSLAEGLHVTVQELRSNAPMPTAVDTVDHSPVSGLRVEVTGSFQPVGPGYTLTIRHPDGEVERQPLLGWTLCGKRWLPVYWASGRLQAVDPQAASLGTIVSITV